MDTSEQYVKWRLGCYILIIKSSALAIDRLYRGCSACGLLPEDKGLEHSGTTCPECGKRS